MTPLITVAIPSIPPRGKLLRRALASVVAQTLPAAAVSIAVDLTREGSATTRNRALAAVATPWTAFLDDDDQFLPHHLELLIQCAELTGADVVYSIPLVENRPDPVLRFGLPFNAYELRQANYIPVTSLVRTELAQAAKFQLPAGSIYDDWGFYLALLDNGAKFVHLPEKTWVWNWHPGQTEGQATRW